MIDTTLLPTENGRGDNMGFYSDYKKKSIYDEKDNYVEKEPSGYKFGYNSKKGMDGYDLNLNKVNKNIWDKLNCISG